MAGDTVYPSGLLQQVGGTDHHLRGDACPVGALTTNELVLDSDDVESGVEEAKSDLFPARSHPEHYYVCLLDSHVTLPHASGVSRRSQRLVEP